MPRLLAILHYPNHYDVIVVDELAGENGMAGVLPIGFFAYDGGRE